jgi:hypothetical protein
MSEDLGRLTDEDLGHLTDEDTGRKHGEHILAAVEASARAAGKPHLLAEAIARAYQELEDGQE